MPDNVDAEWMDAPLGPPADAVTHVLRADEAAKAWSLPPELAEAVNCIVHRHKYAYGRKETTMIEEAIEWLELYQRKVEGKK